MNWVFFLLIAIAYIATAWQQWQSTSIPMQALTNELLHAANDSVALAIGLIGVLALFLGLMKILEDAGLMEVLARFISPLLRWLFPEIPANHPAFGAIAMNFSANIIGLGNAATPFGLKAMQELEKLNQNPGTATNAMVLFLAINTSCLTILPTKIIALRASAGSADPAGIITTILIATICSTVVAIFAAKLLQTREAADIKKAPVSFRVGIFALGILMLLVSVTLLWGKIFSPWIIPTFIVGTLGYGLYKKVDIYTSFTEGAKGGFEIAVKIIPFLVAILVAVAMFRASGALEAIAQKIGPFTNDLGLPPEAIPMVLMRPLSGSGSLGVMSDIFNNPAIGPDSYTGYLVSTMMGSTETTFYVLAVYFGAVQIRRIRHALAAGLLADLAGMIASIVTVKLLLFS